MLSHDSFYHTHIPTHVLGCWSLIPCLNGVCKTYLRILSQVPPMWSVTDDYFLSHLDHLCPLSAIRWNASMSQCRCIVSAPLIPHSAIMYACCVCFLAYCLCMHARRVWFLGLAFACILVVALGFSVSPKIHPVHYEFDCVGFVISHAFVFWSVFFCFF